MPDGIMGEPQAPVDAANPGVGHLVVDLVEAALSSEFATVRSLGAKLVAACGGAERRTLEARLSHIARGGTSRPSPAFADGDSPFSPSVVEALSWPTEPLFLEAEQSAILDRFILTAQQAPRLAAAGLAPRSQALLVGPPGTGKTLAAGHIAARLGLPFHVVRLDTVVSSLLGDTAKNIRGIFDQLNHTGGFLFLDEIDAVAKQRNDSHDVGELKRVVNTLLQALDRLDHRSVVVGATNHPELLDRAVWRRFPYRVTIDLPGEAVRLALWRHYLQLTDQQDAWLPVLARVSDGLSCSDIAEVALAARRMAYIDAVALPLPAVLQSVIGCKNGGFTIPVRPEIDVATRNKMVVDLYYDFGVSRNVLPALFMVSRQMIDKCLRQAKTRDRLIDDLGRQSNPLAED